MGREGDEASWPSADTPALAKLRSLTKLDFCFGYPVPYTLTGVVDALVHLTGLAELKVCLPARVPGRAGTLSAALGQLKGLRSAKFHRLDCCVLEAGCFDLPNLQSLKFVHCTFVEAKVLPGVTTLQSLTRIAFSCGQVPPFWITSLYSSHGCSIWCMHLATGIVMKLIRRWPGCQLTWAHKA